MKMRSFAKTFQSLAGNMPDSCVWLLTACFVLSSPAMAFAKSGDKRQQSEYPCNVGAYTRQGDLIEVTTAGQKLSLAVVRPDGSGESGRATFQAGPYGAECSIFVSRDGTLAAVVTHPLHGPLTVHVWDVSASKWLSSFELAPRPGSHESITALGFWKGGTDLAVRSLRAVDDRHGAASLAVVSTSGKVVGKRRLAKYHTAAVGPAGRYPLMDVGRGRAWTASGGFPSWCGAAMAGTKYLQCTCDGKAVPCSIVKAQTKTPCLYSATSFDKTLTGPPITGKAKIPCANFSGAFPGADLTVGVEDLKSYRYKHPAEFEPRGPYRAKSLLRGYGSVISLCHISTEECRRVVILDPHKHFFDSWVDAGISEIRISPTGKFFALERTITRWDWSNTRIRAEWNELYVFQTDPFRQIAKFGRKEWGRCGSPDAFAIGDAGGIPRLAIDLCGKWSVRTISGR